MTRPFNHHYATKLVVRNLAPSTTAETLNAMFDVYGTVQSIKLTTDVMTGRCGGVAFVTVDEHVTGAAMEALNGSRQDGRIIRVSVERKPGPAAGHDNRKDAG